MHSAVLSESVKDAIQLGYRRWLAARSFKPRRGQREMVAHIARVLGGEACFPRYIPYLPGVLPENLRPVKDRCLLFP